MSTAITTAADLIRWLAAVGDGDRAALQSLYNATSAKLFGTILRILPERSDAEDVLQDVYVTVWRKAAQFDPTRASAVTWLVTIARNRAIDRTRSRGGRTMTTLDAAVEIADAAPLADALLDSGRDAARVHAALAELEPRHAAVIRAAYFEGLSYETLAAREAVPVGTVKSWVRRGLLKMRAGMADGAVADGMGA